MGCSLTRTPEKSRRTSASRSWSAPDRLVLNDVPMLDEDPILDPKDVRRDPVHGRPEPRKPPMNDDEVAIRHDHPGLVFQRRRRALDEVEEALAAGSDVRAVLV